MKSHNLMLPVLLAAFSAGVAGANVRQNVPTAAEIREAQRLEETEALLSRLNEIGALEVNEQEDIRVKKSILEKLKARGRFKEMAGGAGGLCE
jgi:hypothetical protein